MRILLLSVLLSVLSFSSVKDAQDFYNNFKYKEAIKEAKSSTNEYGNPLLHLIWADSANALGLQDEAMSAYERVLMLQENNVKARESLVKLYQDTSRDKLVIDMMKEFKNQFTQEELKGLEMASKSSLKSSLSVDIGYDSNININPGGDILDNYYGSTGNKDVISTTFIRFNGDIGYTDSLTNSDNWYFKAGLNIYHQHNFDESYYNISLAKMELGAGYVDDGYNLYLPLSYTIINYLDRDLLNQYSFSPRANIFLLKDLMIRVNSDYTKREYIKDYDKNKDDTTIGVGSGLYYMFDKNFLFAGLKYEDISADSDTSTSNFTDRTAVTAYAGVNYNINKWLVGRLTYKVRFSEYDDTIDNSTEVRDDTFHQVKIKFSHHYSKDIELYLSGEYIQNNSNYIPTEYDKNIIMLGAKIKY